MRPITLYWSDPDGDTRGRATVETAPTILGRATAADVTLPFPFVSSRHARLFRENERWWIEDLGSTNGVTVDGRSVERAPLEPGAEFALGRLRVRWEDDALADATLMARDLAEPSNDDDLRRLRVLLDLQREFEAGFSPAAALGSVLEAVLEISGANRACILLRESDDLRFAAGRHAEFGPVEGSDFRASRTVVDRALAAGEALFQVEGVGTGDLASASIVEQDLVAVAAVPLRDPDTATARGVLYADSTEAMHRLRGLDREVFLRLASETEAILARIDLRRAAAEVRNREQELAVARRTQQQLLPQALPSIGGWAFAAHCVPSHEVGGDFYDLVRIDATSALVVVADVSGKGLPASLLAASTQAALQIALTVGDEPGKALARVNDFVHDRSDESRFVTAFAGLVDTTGTLTWMSAGHNPALLWRSESGAIEELGLAGAALGALQSDVFDGTYDVQRTRMAPGDLLLIYSDGVTEAENAGGDQFGECALRDLLRVSARDGADAVLAAVTDAVARFVGNVPASDDLTVLVVERAI